MATVKKAAAKSAKKAPQPTKKVPAKKVAEKPVAKTAKKAAPARAVPKKAAPKKAAPVKAKGKPAPVAAKVASKPPAKTAKPVSKATPGKVSTPVKAVVKPKSAVPVKKVPPAPVKTVTKTAPVKSAPVKAAPKPVPAPVGTAKPVAKAPIPAPAPKPAPADIKPSTVGVKPVEPKSTTIARPLPKPETKLVELKPIKTSVATTVKYEPDFTKSVLDDPGQTILNAPTMRYSDAELAEFKDLIMRKLDAAKKELTYLQGLITRKDEMGGDESENRYMTMEDGSISMEREQLSQMASRQITFTDHLEKALMRIENKTYGICRVTGKLIDKARLRAVPHATLSIEAKQMMNK